MKVLLKMLSLQDIHRPQLGSWIGCVSVDESQDWLVSDWVFLNLHVYQSVEMMYAHW